MLLTQTSKGQIQPVTFLTESDIVCTLLTKLEVKEGGYWLSTFFGIFMD